MNIKKNNLDIIVLLYCTLFQNCFANHSETVEEIMRFCNYNGHKYVAISRQSNKLFYSFLKSSTNTRTKSSVGKDNLAVSFNNMDTLILQKDSTILFDEILNRISARKRQKSILIMAKNNVEDFKVSKIRIF